MVDQVEVENAWVNIERVVFLVFFYIYFNLKKKNKETSCEKMEKLNKIKIFPFKR